MTASGGLDNLVTIYKLPADGHVTGELSGQVELEQSKGHSGYISGCAFFEDGDGAAATTKIISSSGDKKCIVWDIEHKTDLLTLESHTADVMDVSILNANVCVSGSVDQRCKVWDIRDKAVPVMTFDGHTSDVNGVHAMKDTNFFLSGGDDSKMILHDIRSFGPLQEYGDMKENQHTISTVSFSHKGRYVFGGYDDFFARGFDTLTGDKCVNYKSTSNNQGQQGIGPTTGRVSCLGINKTGHCLAVGGWDMLVNLYA